MRLRSFLVSGPPAPAIASPPPPFQGQRRVCLPASPSSVPRTGGRCENTSIWLWGTAGGVQGQAEVPAGPPIPRQIKILQGGLYRLDRAAPAGSSPASLVLLRAPSPGSRKDLPGGVWPGPRPPQWGPQAGLGAWRSTGTRRGLAVGTPREAGKLLRAAQEPSRGEITAAAGHTLGSDSLFYRSSERRR